MYRTCLKGEDAPFGQKVSDGPTPMYGHGLNLNEQWVSMLEKVGRSLCLGGFQEQIRQQQFSNIYGSSSNCVAIPPHASSGYATADR